MKSTQLPEIGYVRLAHLIGDSRAQPPIPAIFPFSKSTLYKKIREGLFPAPVKLGPCISAWRVEEIRRLLEVKSDLAD